MTRVDIGVPDTQPGHHIAEMSSNREAEVQTRELQKALLAAPALVILGAATESRLEGRA